MHIPHLHTGTDYHQFMSSLSQQRKTKLYLEIGVQSGVLMSHISADHAVGVDPDFLISANIALNKKKTCLLKMTSDEFFDNHPLQLAGFSGPPDLIFLDGLHLFEFLLRDFYNSESIAKKDTAIFMHDCLPLDDIMTIRDVPEWAVKMKGTRFAHWWTGDVWKIILILKKFRPDLDVKYIDCAPTGLVCVTRLDPHNKVLVENYSTIVDDFNRLPNTSSSIDDMYSTINLTSSDQAMADTSLFSPENR